MNFIADPTLALYLPLYELDGASFMSKDKHGHLCTVAGAIWRLQGRSFDGTDDFINLGNSLNLYQGQFTWEFWVKQTSVAANYKPFLGTATLDKHVRGYQDSADLHLVFKIRQSDGTVIGLSCTDLLATLNVFGHVVFTGDGSTLRGYLNSVASTVTSAHDGTINTATREDLKIGAERNVYWFEGIIGSVRLYSRALTPQEIQYNYLATKWRYR